MAQDPMVVALLKETPYGSIQSYDDTPTAGQMLFNKLKSTNENEAINKGSRSFVTPPEMEAPDTNFPGTVITPNELMYKALGGGLLPSYGGGRHTIYTPTPMLYTPLEKQGLE